MSILSELSRITNLRNNIRTKLIALGILNNANASLSDCYTGINGIVAQAAKTVTPSASSQTAVASGRYTTGAVTVAAVPTEAPNTITSNGTYTATSGKWWSGVTVNVSAPSPTLQDKTVTSNGTVRADSGYDGLGAVTVNVPQGIPIEVSTDAGMTIVLTSANVGKAYKFTGTTGTYINGDIYIVEEN